MNSKITVTIITYNEEEFIKECIESAWQVADEIIVVDSLSTDKTQEIARSLGARVYEHSFMGDGLQKDYGVQFAANDWILHMDADERLDEKMVAEIKKIKLTDTSYDAFAFKRKNYIGARWQKVWYPDYMVRLYHKARCRFLPIIVHTSLSTKNYKKLEGNIIHYSYKDLSDCILRADKYSRLDAQLFFEKQREINSWEPALHGAVSFFKFYFLKKGVFYGFDGLAASLIGGLRSFLKYAYLLEMRRNNFRSKTAP